MSRPAATWLPRSSLTIHACFVVCAAAAQLSAGATILLKDGRQLQGKVGGPISGLADSPLSPKADGPRSITFVDDGLKRVFVPTGRIQQVLDADGGQPTEKIGIEQQVARSGGRVSRVGPIDGVTPFDQFGHRTLRMMTDKGPLNVFQGITLITPIWTRVEGLMVKSPLIWDMRIATSSIPKDQLRALLARRIDPKNIEHRLKVVRLFLQMDHFQDAQKELEAVIADFPGEKRLPAQVQSLRQLHAKRIIAEIGVRRKAGQHQLAHAMLEKFPVDDVAADLLQQVREMLENYRETQRKLDTLHADLAALVAAITDSTTRLQCAAILKEMRQELTINTLDRMAAYFRLSDDATLDGEQKVALAISGWLLGADNADKNLAVALSLGKIRSLVTRYLNEQVKLRRDQLFSEFRAQEAASPLLVSQLIAHIKPPLETPPPSVGQPGFHKLRIPVGIDQEPDVNYFVQLPPQYDPHMRYPTIVTLNGAGTTPEQQIDWWAGAMDANGVRLGQGTRHGYIVVAVDWLKEGQKDYEFSAREHAAVLGSLRDACRRFSIDTDRVFLTGHSAGGNAVWDIGLAHPDLWAGVIPIVAVAEKYCQKYWENAKLVPFYVLAGEMDGRKTLDNADTLNRYMNKRFDVTVTEYIGRGHEDFYEDILNIFDWMSHRESRNFFPKSFAVSTMRSWDNYFWCIEVSNLPSRGIVEPIDWPPRRGVSPIEISATVLATNGLSIKSGDIKVAVWISPELLDLNQKVQIKLNGNSMAGNGRVNPDLSVLLEDVRTRADRLHPFWAKVE